MKITKWPIAAPFPQIPCRAVAASVLKKFLEPLRCQGGVARRILNVAMPEDATIALIFRLGHSIY